MVYKTYCISKQNLLYDEEEEITKKNKCIFMQNALALKQKQQKKTIEIK